MNFNSDILKKMIFKIKTSMKVLLKKIFFKIKLIVKFIIKRVLKLIIKSLRSIRLGFVADYLISIFRKLMKRSEPYLEVKSNLYSHHKLNKIKTHFNYSNRSKLILEEIQLSIKNAK